MAFTIGRKLDKLKILQKTTHSLTRFHLLFCLKNAFQSALIIFRRSEVILTYMCTGYNAFQETNAVVPTFSGLRHLQKTQNFPVASGEPTCNSAKRFNDIFNDVSLRATHEYPKCYPQTMRPGIPVGNKWTSGYLTFIKQTALHIGASLLSQNLGLQWVATRIGPDWQLAIHRSTVPLEFALVPFRTILYTRCRNFVRRTWMLKRKHRHQIPAT